MEKIKAGIIGSYLKLKTNYCDGFKFKQGRLCGSEKGSPRQA